jgi:hypothetical protein
MGLRMEKMKLIYICGLGFSGSTLLDLLLGSHSQMESVGEVHKYSQYQGMCTCLKNVNDCHYWQEITKRFQQYLTEIGTSPAEVDTSNIRYPDLTTKLKFFLKSELHFSPEFIRSYGINNYYLYKAILDATGKAMIVDSSKQLKRAMCLKFSGKFDVKIIYLIRECCGYLHSRKKRDYGTVVSATLIDKAGNVERQIQKSLFDGPVKTSLTWYFSQIAYLTYLKKHHRDNTILVHYTNLCSDPEKELTRICDFIDVPFEENMLHFGNMIHHNIAGNPMRNNKAQNQTIRYNDAWKQHLTSSELWLCHVFNNKMNNKHHLMTF